jgi:hypothetical protein
MSPPPPPPLAGEELQDCEEGRGESSPSPCASHLEPQDREVLVRIHQRLRRAGTHQQTLADPFFERRLFRHLHRLPRRYLLDHDLDAKADDVLLHWGILDECADPDKRPVFHARYIKVHNSLIDSFGFIIIKKQKIPSFPLLSLKKSKGEFSRIDCVCVHLHFIDKQSVTARADYDGSYRELEDPCEKLMEDLSLERRKAVDSNDSMSISSRYSYVCSLWQNPLMGYCFSPFQK